MIVRSVCTHVDCIPKYTWSRHDVASPRSTSFINFFHVGAIFCFVQAIVMSSTCSDKNYPCFRWTNRHVQVGTFSASKSQWNFLERPASGCPYKFRSEPQGLQCLTMTLAICQKRYPCVWTFWLRERWAIFGASSIFAWVSVDTASAACPAQSGSLALTSITFAAVIWDADEPCSSNTAYGPGSSFYNVTSEHDPVFVLLILRF